MTNPRRRFNLYSSEFELLGQFAELSESSRASVIRGWIAEYAQEWAQEPSGILDEELIEYAVPIPEGFAPILAAAEERAHSEGTDLRAVVRREIARIREL